MEPVAVAFLGLWTTVAAIAAGVFLIDRLDRPRKRKF